MDETRDLSKIGERDDSKLLQPKSFFKIYFKISLVLIHKDLIETHLVHLGGKENFERPTKIFGGDHAAEGYQQLRRK